MPPFNPLKTKQELGDFIKDSFAKAGFTRAVIAISGGVDSATSCALAVRALGVPNVFPIILPYGDLNLQGILDAQDIVKTFQIPIHNTLVIDIKQMVDSVLQSDPSTDNIRKGNVMARMRMIVLFDQAKKRNALVVGTENRTEHLLGYFTRFGDEASDIDPLRNLYKTQVYDLACNLGVPLPVLLRKPSAGLWEGQTDEGEFGFTYKEADEILYQIYDRKLSVDDIVSLGFQREVAMSVLALAERNAFKHSVPFIPPT